MKDQAIPDEQKEQSVENDNTARLTEELKQAQEKIIELENALLRSIADLQNVRRRANEERLSLLKSGSYQLIEKLLPALDNFDRAFVNLPKELEKNDWLNGVMAIEKSLFEALKEEGLEVINKTDVEFDPNLHEAIAIDENNKKGLIVEIYEKGFKLNGKTLRVAKVKVGSKA